MKIVYLSCLILILLVNFKFSQCQVQPEQGSQQYKQFIRQKQYANRDANKMNYQNVQSYTIKTEGIDQFFIMPQVDQQVKCQVYIYWKESNIFISSQYRSGQEIRVIVYQDDRRIIYDRSLYMVDGFSFNAKKQSTYQIRFIGLGKIQKLISLTINKMLQVSEKKLTDTSDLVNTEQKLNKIRSQIQAFFTISQRNFMIEQRLTEKVLGSTKIYMGYQTLEILIVLAVTVLQTIFITKILSSISIV